MAMPVSVKWSELGISGTHTVRDLWRQKDLGTFSDEFSSVVPRHGTLFVKVTAKR
jgi:alpha-galactosidase